MTDADKTREQLLEEVAALRARVAAVEGLLSEEFVFNLSYELRYAFTSVRLMVALLWEHGEEDPERLDAYQATLRLELQLLHTGIEKLLHWMYLQTRSEPQPPVEELHLSAVDLNAVVESEVADAQILADAWKLTLTFAPQPDLPPAHGDESLLRNYVLHMILTNALTYTPGGGEVAVTTGTQEADGRQWVGFTVRDTGPGIPPDEQRRVFEPYFRGAAAHGMGYRGTGLGLTIARRTVDSLQGRIELASTGVPGEGTTVSVWLPVAD